MRRREDAKHERFLVQVGRNVARRREKAGLTQERLAELLGIDPRAVQRLESGETNPTLLTVARVAEAIGVLPDRLLRPDVVKNKKPSPQ